VGPPIIEYQAQAADQGYASEGIDLTPVALAGQKILRSWLILRIRRHFHSFCLGAMAEHSTPIS